MSIRISKNSFDEKALHSDVPVLVAFLASWCGACKWMTPMLEELAEDVKNKARVYTVDAVQDPDLANRYSIISIPTVLVLKRGQIVNKVTVFRDKNDLRGLLGV